MEETLKIYTDGGARGNPGPAAAAFVVIIDGKIYHKDSKFLGSATNNEAEYRAVIMALNWLKANLQMFAVKEAQFFLDSQLVVRQLSGVYKVKSENLKRLVREASVIVKMLNGVKLSFVSVGREENKLADRLVNLKLDENIS